MQAALSIDRDSHRTNINEFVSHTYVYYVISGKSLDGCTLEAIRHGLLASYAQIHGTCIVIRQYLFGYSSVLRGNVGENQRGAPACRCNLCSYSGYQKYEIAQVTYIHR